MSRADQLHLQAQLRLRRVTGAAVAGVLAAITLDRSEEIRDEYQTTTVRIVRGGQLAAAGLAAAYIAAYVPPVRSVDLRHALRGTLLDADDGRSLVGLVRMWSLLDDGVPPLDARMAAGSIARNLAEGDLQAACRVGLDEGAHAAERTARWAKLPAPGACEWCQEIANQGYRYRSAESIPFHSHGPCRCSYAPEFGE